MKKLILLALFVLSLVAVTSASASIDWMGNEWPYANSTVSDSDDLTIFIQVYKAGVTDSPGQGAEISGTLEIPNISFNEPMVYNTDYGNNDEYMVTVPQELLGSVSYLDVQMDFVDQSDDTHYNYYFVYNVSHPGVLDINVTFSLCLDGVEYAGIPCITGSNPALGDWVNGVALNNVEGDLWSATVLFSSASVQPIEYKYKRNGCGIWEDIPNRTLELPTNTTTLVLDTVAWENGPGICDPVATVKTDWSSLKAQYR